MTPNPLLALSLSETLHAGGITTYTAHTAADALEALKRSLGTQQNYDAIILDHSLKEMTSTEFAGHVRALPHCLQTPMILLCSISKCMPADEIRRSGFSACISQPVRSTELFKALNNALIGTDRTTAVLEPLSFQLRSGETGGKLRALIVDDNEINRKLAKILIEQLGGMTEIAQDGMQAVDACTQKTFDLILMDAHMPIMDGVEASSRIRELENGSKRHTLIIALTANAMSGDRERYLAAGMDEYLSKPINEMALMSVLRKFDLITESVDIPTGSVESAPDADHQANLPILDSRIGVELSFGNRETWRTILGMLFNDLPDYSARLIAATASGDREMLRQTAHKLAGASSYCGTPSLNHQAKRVERLAKEGDMDSAANATDELLQQIEQLLELQGKEGLYDSDHPIY